ncbi:hypothetical protein PAHAL_3G283600 [Panicum hallii]|uniref:Uncharacterized protein n=1 Tax=Panicum hallii TaxID=206008 RepID=A0A2T8KJU5_9POAL|nr:hypothetical protein PAHAL_3G283600 [Panicum hallii]
MRIPMTTPPSCSTRDSRPAPGATRSPTGHEPATHARTEPTEVIEARAHGHGHLPFPVPGRARSGQVRRSCGAPYKPKRNPRNTPPRLRTDRSLGRAPAGGRVPTSPPGRGEDHRSARL